MAGAGRADLDDGYVELSELQQNSQLATSIQQPIPKASGPSSNYIGTTPLAVKDHIPDWTQVRTCLQLLCSPSLLGDSKTAKLA